MTVLSRHRRMIFLTRDRLQKRTILSLKALISLAIVWFLVTRVDFTALMDRLGADAAFPLAAGVVAGVLIMCVTALRWWGIHHRISAPIPFPFSIPATMECYALNLALPGSVGGDIVRAARARRLCGRLREAIMAVLVDRGANLAAQMAMCIAALPLLHGAMASADLEAAILVIAGTGAAGAVCVYFAPPFLGRSPLRRKVRIVGELMRVGFIFRRIAHLPRAVVEIALLSFVIQGLNIAMLWAAVAAIGHPTLPLFTLAVAMAFGMLGSALPISFGGLGVREGAVAWVLLETGMPQQDAFMIAIVFGALVLSQAIPGLFIWAFGRMPRIMELADR